MLVEVFSYKRFSKLDELNQIKLLVYGPLRVENPPTNCIAFTGKYMQFCQVLVLDSQILDALIRQFFFSFSFCYLIQSLACALKHSGINKYLLCLI